MKWCLFSISFVLILASCSTFVKIASSTVQEKDFGYIKTSNVTLTFQVYRMPTLNMRSTVSNTGN